MQSWIDDSKALELVKSASQINGCAYCIDMHNKDARAMGESEQQRYALAWRKAWFCSERAALEWTKAVTLTADDHVPDETYESVRRQFSEQELVNPIFS